QCICSSKSTACNSVPNNNSLLCSISVVRSKYASYVGLTGILIQEFKHVFKVITQKNELKVIPKRNSVFEIEVNGFVFERSAKKFKSKGTIDL
uniref:Ribonuclease P protein subunit p29 n=1 Tax=Neogobius melanostomus TaxID=47308 RepID=A0A8C6UW64_9GOBI